jgi:acetyltransferase-like isoleucine patch superfamily enzyme
MSEDRAHDPRIINIQRELFELRKSRVGKYRDLVIGRSGLGPLVLYETVILLSSWVPGALGLFLRSRLFPLILGSVGRNVVFGVNVTLRHPHKIAIGSDVVIDDGCCLDAKGTDNRGIVIGTGDSELQERRHHRRRSRQPRFQLRDFLRLARARRQAHPHGGLYLSGRRRPSLRSR